MGKSDKINKYNRTYNKSEIINRYSKEINYFFIVLISVFLTVIPFFRGLYFRENYMPSIVYISAVFMLYVLYKLFKKDYKIVSSYMDIAMLALPIAYLISFFFSANSMDAMDSVLKYAAYFMIYKIASDLSKEKNYRKALEYAVMTSILVMALSSILVAFGFIDLKGVVTGKQLFGLYQYSNATASALGAILFLALGLLLMSENRYEKIYYNIVLSVIFPAFVLTLSRGAYVIFVLLAVINLILLNSSKRVQFLYSLIALTASNGLFLLKYYSTESADKAVVYYICGVILFLFVQMLYEKYLFELIDRAKSKTVNILILTTIVVFSAAVVVMFTLKTPAEYKIEHANGEAESWKYEAIYTGDLVPNEEYTIEFNVKSNIADKYSYRVVINSKNEAGEQDSLSEKYEPVENEFNFVSYKFTTKADTKNAVIVLYNYKENSYTVYKDIKVIDSKGNIINKYEKFKYLPEALANRLADINLKTESVYTRAFYLRDGIKIVNDYILTGAGGGGWKNLYRQYQSLPYASTEAHNFYLQYAIETGVLGLLVLLAVYFLYIQRVWISLFIEKDYRQLPLYMALFMMMGHAVLDFDLSLTALAFLFWMMLGMTIESDKKRVMVTAIHPLVQGIVPIIAVLVLTISASHYMGILQGNKASTLIKTDIDKAVKLYESAIRKDSLNMNYHMDYMQIMKQQYQKKKDPALLMKMKASLDKVLDSGLTDIRYTSVVVNQLLSIGELDKAIEVTNKAVLANPMVAEVYMFKIDVNYQIAKSYFENKQKEAARPFLENMIEAGKQFDDINKVALKPLKEPEHFKSMVGLAENWISQIEKSKS